MLADADGLTSTATVQVYIAPVNDAPRDRDTVHSIRLTQSVTLSVADLLANAYDIEGDRIDFIGLHLGADGQAGTAGTAVFDAASQTVTFTANSLGFGSIAYDVIDARGEAATLTYKLKVRPLNDPPKARNDYGLQLLEDQVLVINPATLLANDTDENGDTLSLVSISRFADLGKVVLRADGMIEFRPKPSFNGSDSFAYTISDGHGGFSTATVFLTVRPRNDGPVLRNDLVKDFEGDPLFVIPGEAFGNDLDPQGDVIFFKRSSVLGMIDHRFLSSGYSVSARLADGTALPGSLHFDAASMTFSGSVSTPTMVDIWVTDPANGRVFNYRTEVTTALLAAGVSLRSDVLDGYQVRPAFAQSFEFGAGSLRPDTYVTAQYNGTGALPAWLSFDAATLKFTGTPPAGTVPFEVTLLFTRMIPGGSVSIEVFSDTMLLDPARLAAGQTYDSDIALFDLKSGTVSAGLKGNKTLPDYLRSDVRPLPDYLNFDAATRSFSLSAFTPGNDAQVAVVQVVFTPGPRVLPNGTYASSERGFTLEFRIDPQADLTTQIGAINQALAGNSWFASQGLFALDFGGAGAITAKRESGAPLDSWLHFDPASLSFTGTPPPEWVGAVPVRIDVAAGGGRPAMSIITEAVVDDTFRLVAAPGASTGTSANQIDLNTGADFNGTVVISYDAVDEKGGVSIKPALIFFEVRPTRERPEAATDLIAARESQSTRFAITDLLRNDFDAEGDALRITALGQPAHGSVTIELAHLSIAATLAQVSGAVWSAVLDGGGALPAWLSIDAATGTLSGDVPLNFKSQIDVLVTRTLSGGSSENVHVVRALNGNDGAFALYTPLGDYSGEDRLVYTVTDDREGPSNGTVVLQVAPINDPPVARPDLIQAVEDTALTINPALLLANDYDVDGNPIRFVGVGNPSHGTVSFDGTLIHFTPDANFSGKAMFDYVVTDDTHGSSVGKVTVNVVSTNRAPVAVADLFQAREDTPFIFGIAGLIGNDFDPDGDAFTFQSMSTSAAGGRIHQLPDGRYEFVPNENFNENVSGPVSFNYVISDGRKSATGSFTFNLEAVNDAPIANPDGAGTLNDPDGVFTLKQDTSVTIDLSILLRNDRDVEGDSFQIVDVFGANSGTVAMIGNTAVFTAAAGYIGDAGFRYRITDSHGASSIGYATLLVMPNVPLPIASSDFGFEMLEDSYLDIDPAQLLANDTVPEGSTVTFLGLQGATLLANGKYRVTPPANFNGELVLHYSIQNEQGFPISTTVTINVLPVNDAPVALGDSMTMTEDQPLTIFAAQLTENDSDADQGGFAISAITATNGVTVTQLPFGQLQITPAENRNGPAWFEYEITDGTGLTSTARVTIAIAAVNDAPVIGVVPTFNGTEDQPFSVTLPVGLVSDPDGDTLIVELRGPGGLSLPSWLHYDAQTRTLSGNPPANFNGSVPLEIAAFDGQAQTVSRFFVNIAAVNDAPVVAVGLSDVTFAEDNGFAYTINSSAFADADGDPLSYSVSLANGDPLPSWISFDGLTLSGSAPANFNGELTLRVTASDGQASVSDDLVLRVTAVNDAPYVANALADQRFAEDQAIDIALPANTFTDVDGDALTYSASLLDGSVLPAWLSFAGGRIFGTPPLNFNGSFDIRITVSDGQISTSDDFRLTIDPVNDAPVLVIPLADVTSNEDTAIAFSLPAGAFADADGNALTYIVRQANGAALPTWLSYAAGQFSGTPPQDFNGTLDIEVLASDGALAASDVFRITINPINDAPVIITPLADLAVAEDQSFSLAIATSGFADVDLDTLTFTLTRADGSALPAWLSYVGGRLVGQAPADFNGSIDLALTASDGSASVTDQFRLTVLAVNDAPVLVHLLPDLTVNEDQAINLLLDTSAFADIDGPALSFTARRADGSALPAWLTFDGARFTGTPPANYNGAIDIEVTASDGLLQVSDTFRLTVQPVNDAPLLQSALPDVAVDEDTPVNVLVPAGTFGDVDGDALTLTAKLAGGSALPSWLSFDGSRFTGTPPANFNGVIDITVTASDTQLTASDTFRLTISPVNDAPVLVTPLADISVNEDTLVDFTVPAGAFSDPDGQALSYSATLAGGAALPSWLTFAGGRLTGTPPANFNGVFDITITASDGSLSTNDTLRLTILPVNDAPVLVMPLADVSVNEDTLVDFAVPAGAFNDPDGQVLSYSATLAGGGALPAWLSFANGRFTGTPPANFNGTFDLTVTASDGTLSTSDTLRLTIVPVNDAPTAANSSATVTSGVVFNGQVVASDVDGDALTYSVTTAPLHGTVSLNAATGSYSYTATSGYTGSDSFVVGVNDGHGGTTSATLSYTVNAPAVNNVTGTAGNDVLTGTAFVDNITGLAGNDTISGLADNDTLDGGIGDDTLTGGTGDDVLIGGDGIDTFNIGLGDGFDSFNGGIGTDTIKATASNVVIGMTAITAIEAITSNGLTGVTIAGSGAADTLNFTGVTLTGIGRIDGGAGNDVITGPAAAATFAGGAGDDTITGGAGNDVFLFSGTGDGFDAITGGTGTDTIQATAAGTIIGLVSLATIEAITAGGFTGVTVSGSANADTLNFTGVTLTGITRIDGGAGNDTITGPAAAATFAGGAGDDTITGGAGNDTFQFTGTGDGFDAITGGTGTDTIAATVANTVIGLRSLTTVEAITAGGFAGVTISGSGAADTLNFTGVALTGITRIDGGAGNDTITGPAAASTFAGGAGDDTITGGAGNDVFLVTGTGDGFDAITGGAGTDTIQATAASTVIGLISLATIEAITAGGFAGVTVSGSAAADTLNFTGVTLTGITRIDGGAGNDTITGSAAAATIAGGAGDDTITGGAGNDTFQFSGTGDGFDAITGGAGTDTIAATAAGTVIGLRSIATIEAITAGGFAGVSISGSAAADTLNFAGVTLTGITRIDGGAGNDSITGSAGDDTLMGGIGTDILNGAAGIDTADYSYMTAGFTLNLALTTAQTIATGDSDTLSNIENVIGGAGADTLTGTTGDNVLNGGAGNDRLTGGTGNDTLIGGTGTDTAVYAGISTTYSISTLNGVVRVVDNAATVDGNDGTDVISGIEQLSFKNNVTVGVVSPIILDLDGNGVQTVSAADSKALYDLDGDGLADDTSWIGNTEGFLFLDRDNNGTVTNAGEFSFIDDVPGATSDLAGLKAFDSNNDGKLSSADAKWASFKVWRDSDGDGAVDTGEVLTMAQAGVASFNLNGTAFTGNSAFGEVAVLNTGSYTRTNGATMQFYDAALTYFSAATNTPDLTEQTYDVSLKAKKYGISIAGGIMTLQAKKQQGTVDAGAGRIGANATLNFRDKTIGMMGAIILDLDGNGIDLKHYKKNQATFDLNGDGAADDTGWTSARDGFLVIDRDGDGLITDAAELNFAVEKEDAMSALEGLAKLDSNNDGKLDSSDARFGELRIWADRNQNGVTDAGELLTLTAAGLTSIKLTATAARDYTIKAGDNAVISTATFTRTNGSIGTLGNVSLGYVPGAAPISSSARGAPLVGGSTGADPRDGGFGRDGMIGGSVSINPPADDAEFGAAPVAAASAIDPAISAAIAALRGAAGNSELSPFKLSGDSAVFDAIERSLSGEKVELMQITAAFGLPDEAHTQELPVSIMAFVEDQAAPLTVNVALGSSAQQLALLRQDIAGFGGSFGIDKPMWHSNEYAPLSLSMA